MLRGAAIAVDSMAISSRVPTHFILPPVLLADKAGPAGGLSFIATLWPRNFLQAQEVLLMCPSFVGLAHSLYGSLLQWLQWVMMWRNLLVQGPMSLEIHANSSLVGFFLHWPIVLFKNAPSEKPWLIYSARPRVWLIILWWDSEDARDFFCASWSHICWWPRL